MTTHPTVRLRARGLTLGYGERIIAKNLSVDVPAAALTAIVGPNACGKSTLLRSMARLLKPHGGVVELDGHDLRRLRSRQAAREIGFLPQGLETPENVRVIQLVRRGRYAHQPLLGTWTPADEEAVQRALSDAGVVELADRAVEALSGGQRQRVWIAMVLAQETSHLLLDEPTTFLDIAHQLELLRLLERLRDDGRTVVAVLHDLNQAARYADHLIAMRDGMLVAAGPPADVVDADLVRTVFGVEAVVVPDPVAGTPMVVPR